MLSNYEEGPIKQKGMDIKMSSNKDTKQCSQSINLKCREGLTQGLTHIKSSKEISELHLSREDLKMQIEEIPTS